MPSTLMRNPELAASANTIDEMINDSLLRLYTFRIWVEVPIPANMVSILSVSWEKESAREGSAEKFSSSQAGNNIKLANKNKRTYTGFLISFPGYLPIHPTGDARICLPKECAYVRPVSELPSV